jgi:hypothetical protein
VRVFPIVGILVVAWLLILGEVYVFFNVILTYAPPIHEIGSLTLLALLKVGATLGLGFLWFTVMQGLARAYTTSRLGRRTPRTSS